ncbi:dGTP triphosphohydrolase [Mucilaginibacter dorajii]|uniref:Deoxyguanosinetriphosphate triphosphohydrolase n=1 Tax=Mucilaginibacter dorajii TaxID=692994 RepID=A0ABP7PM84_9SPHI|nr:dNTP triphosphohydrolase [Mucilaginibacter dorajii]MCS3733716.1 dGTPase [Mucilaginibacter dorajii]
MMNLNKLYSTKRPGKTNNGLGVRSEFQRDFDRLIFSSPFRRLQNKTQVFPLPGSVFVHNRLTHSLEVSSVGRSLGKIAGAHIAEIHKSDLEGDSIEFYKYHLAEVIAAGCLAHDIGNPAFGHSGEKAISNFFENGGVDKNLFKNEEWKDLTNFEGNANAFRILTNQFEGRLPGGYRITYATLATILKYPCESTAVNSSFKHLKKYGFFQSEKSLFLEIAEDLQMIREQVSPLCYGRHPFVYLLEAADDICYRIIDFEDAHRLRILSDNDIKEAFLNLIADVGRTDDNMDDIKKTFTSIGDNNEKIGYLRSRAINTLTLQASEIFINNLPLILQGKFNNTLIDHIQDSCTALKNIETISKEKLYNHNTVVELELAGYNVMYDLLEAMIPGSLKPESKRNHLEKKALKLVPSQFGDFSDSKTPYIKALNVLDYVSGMTDLYATELYRKVKGIEIGKHH